MKISIITSILILVAHVASAVAAETASTKGFVYTADEFGGAVSVIDLASGRVQTVKIPIMPHNAQISADGKWVFAVGPAAGADHGKGHDAAPRGQLVMLDSGTLSSGNRPGIEVGRHLAHVAVDREGKLAYVTDSRDNAVKVVNVADRKIIGEIATGALPHGLRMSPDEREIYTANVKDGTVSVIDVGLAKEVARLPIGKAPVQVGFTPDGKRVYVSLRDEDSVAVIDTKTRTRLATVKVGYKPIQVYATPDAKYIYVANQGTEKRPGNTVSVIETSSNKVVSTVVAGRGAHGVVASDDGGRVFVSNIYDNSVSVIDTDTRKVVKTFKVGKGPNGVTYRAGS